MNFQQLKYFKLACHYRNISKAAESANISQSSITIAIKKLEKEYGVKLIQRQKIGFTLTLEGEKFLELTDGILEHCGRVDAIMSEIAGKHKTIRLGIPPMTYAVVISKFFSEFHKECPGVHLTFTEAGGNELLWQVKEGLLDMAVIPVDSNYTDADLDFIELMRYEVVFCISDKNPLAKETSITIPRLSGEPLVMFSDKFYHTKKMLLLFEKEKVEARIFCKTTQLSTMEEMISKGIAGGFLFKERAEIIPGINAISLDPKVYTDLILVWKKGSSVTSDMKKLMGFLEKI